MTVSTWFKVETFDTSWQALVAKGETPSWRLARENNTLNLSFAGFHNDDADGADGNVNVQDNAWHHAAGTISGGINVRLYVDGVLDGTATVTDGTFGENNLNMRIGSNPNNGRYFDGLLDEVRVSNVPRSANWIWAKYMNTASNSVFCTYRATKSQATIILVR